MKITFKKDEKSLISVFQDIDGKEEEFSYADMIKELVKSKEIEGPEILGDFSDAEIASIKRMVKLINAEISNTDVLSDDEEDRGTDEGAEV